MKLRKELIILNEISKKGAVDLIIYRQREEEKQVENEVRSFGSYNGVLPRRELCTN